MLKNQTIWYVRASLIQEDAFPSININIVEQTSIYIDINIFQKCQYIYLPIISKGWVVQSVLPGGAGGMSIPGEYPKRCLKPQTLEA